MLFARNFGVSSPHDTCGWHSCAECRLKLGCVRVCTHSILYVCVCACAIYMCVCTRVCVYQRAREYAQGSLSSSVFRCMYLTGSLGSFTSFRSPGVLWLSHSVADRALFSRVCGRRSVACHEKRGRGVENERGRGREKAAGDWRGTGGIEREKRRQKEREGNRESREGR